MCLFWRCVLEHIQFNNHQDGFRNSCTVGWAFKPVLLNGILIWTNRRSNEVGQYPSDGYEKKTGSTRNELQLHWPSWRVYSKCDRADGCWRAPEWNAEAHLHIETRTARSISIVDRWRRSPPSLIRRPTHRKSSLRKPLQRFRPRNEMEIQVNGQFGSWLLG